jgi:hypothetical protein
MRAAAQKAAERASNDDDRSAWLRIAQGWLGMIRGRRTRDQKDFDSRVDRRETGQKRSNESH